MIYFSGGDYSRKFDLEGSFSAVWTWCSEKEKDRPPFGWAGSRFFWLEEKEALLLFTAARGV